MRRGTAVLGLAVLLALAVGTSARAQQDAKGRWRATSPSSGSHTGIARTNPPVTVIVVPQTATTFINGQTVFSPAQPVAFFSIPAVLLSDGTILADFGMGFEPVNRSCSSQILPSSQVTVVAGNGAVISNGAPTYTQPVPNQATSSQQMLGLGGGNFRTLTTISQASCFTWDASGRPFVLHP